MERYRITTEVPPDDAADADAGVEQTWVLLPDRPSAIIQAQELSQRKKALHVRVYHEIWGSDTPPRTLELDLPARDAVSPGRIAAGGEP